MHISKLSHTFMYHYSAFACSIKIKLNFHHLPLWTIVLLTDINGTLWINSYIWYKFGDLSVIVLNYR